MSPLPGTRASRARSRLPFIRLLIFPVFPGVTVLAAEHAVDADDVLFAFQTWNRAFPPVWRLRALIGQASAIVLQNRVSFPESTAKKRGTQPLDLQWFSSALEASFRKVKDCH